MQRCPVWVNRVISVVGQLLPVSLEADIVMTGQPASWKTFLNDSPAAGRSFVESWIWPHVVTAWHAAKLMVAQRSGLIVELIEQDNVGYHGAFYFDMMEVLLKRLVFALANELGPEEPRSSNLELGTEPEDEHEPRRKH